jgi:two-component system OmpR family response regulator
MILTPRRQTTDKVAAFKRGVDDYLTKLFMMAELLVRVEALLRHVLRQTSD